MVVEGIRPHHKNVRRGSKLTTFRGDFLKEPSLVVSVYFIVTFKAVVSPAFTVAVVLTLANPGAATVTV